MKRIVVTAKEVKGNCHAGIEPGMKFVIDGLTLDFKKSDKVCAVAFASMYYRLFALSHGAKLNRFIQCPDTHIWDPDKGFASVLYEITVEDKSD